MLKVAWIRCLSFDMNRSVRYTLLRLTSGRQMAPIYSNRLMATKPSFSSKEEQEPKRRFRGPSSWRNFFWTMGLGFVTGVGIYFWMKRITEKRKAAVDKRLSAGFGTPAIGGPWELVDFEGNVKTEKDYFGKWLLIYFGFTHCPDICPEELDKLIKSSQELKTIPHVRNRLHYFSQSIPFEIRRTK